jgi:hypothetical protein
LQKTINREKLLSFMKNYQIAAILVITSAAVGWWWHKQGHAGFWESAFFSVTAHTIAVCAYEIGYRRGFRDGGK